MKSPSLSECFQYFNSSVKSPLYDNHHQHVIITNRNECYRLYLSVNGKNKHLVGKNYKTLQNY